MNRLTGTSAKEWKRVLHIDLETYSSVDLAKSGVYKYAESEDFEILLFAYAYNNDPVQVLDLINGDLLPEDIVEDLLDPEVLKVAHNAAFERICLSAYANRYDWFTDYAGSFLGPEGWYCTMVHAAMCGLPSSLKQAGEALGLSEDKQKLAFGQRLIRYFCMPCKPTKANGQRCRNLPVHDLEKWKDFIEYNRQDVVTEMEIEKRLSDIYTMPVQELERYWIDQKINDAGIGVDMDMVSSILEYGKIHSQQVSQKAMEIAGVNIQSPARLLAWVKERTGLEPPGLAKAIVEELLETVKVPEVLEVLKLRLEAGKTSVKKYEVFKRAVTKDGRIHGCFQFYGSRTGRFAGRLLQPQNLPRNSFDNIDAARQMVKGQMWEMLECCFGSVNDVFSTLVRTALVPPEGKAYAVADYSAIEARVIAWLAGETWRMDAFHEGRDIYCESASMMFGVPVEKHGANGHLRKQGKVAELACGYGGGVNALKAFGAEKMGLTETQMSDIVAKWRTASPKICGLWKTVEELIRHAMNKARYSARKTIKEYAVYEGEDFLSTRRAKSAVQAMNFVRNEFYPGIPFSDLPKFSAVEINAPDWVYGLGKKLGAKVKNNALYVRLPSGRCLVYQNLRYDKEEGFGNRFCFDGQNQVTRKWETVYTWGGKLTENIVQAIARDCLCTTIDRMHQKYPYCPIVMHIHDEIVVEVPKDSAEEWLQKILETMAEPLEWAPELELKGAGFTAEYYQKD